MSKPAIIVDGISKAYRIGVKEERFPTFRDAVINAAKAPLRRFRDWRTEAADRDDAFWALKDVSFEVQAGEVVGIIGRNGAGKSTLLKILSRITEPTSGQVRIRGRVASLLEVGTGFHPELTGRENIYLNGAILGMKRTEIASKFDEIVAFSEVEKFLDTPVKHYSSGMFVRLAFAVAAHLDPEILIVDEVLAVGDAEFQKKCLGKMQKVSRDGGRTVLFVSHNMVAVESLCDRGLLLQSGLVASDGEAETAIRHYLKNTESTATNLSERSDRQGTGRLITKTIRLVDSTKRITNQIRCGDDIAVELDYGNVRVPESTQINVGIGFYNIHGHPITFLQNEPVAVKMTAASSGGTLCCRIPRFPLTPGRYWINCALYSGAEECDVVEHALSFDVVEGDFFGTGKLPYYSPGGVLVDQQWTSRGSLSALV